MLRSETGVNFVFQAGVGGLPRCGLGRKDLGLLQRTGYQ